MFSIDSNILQIFETEFLHNHCVEHFRCYIVVLSTSDLFGICLQLYPCSAKEMPLLRPVNFESNFSSIKIGSEDQICGL